MESDVNSSDNKIVATNQRKGFEGTRLENPFTLKMGQVFTGFGVGCGIGIGVGRPTNIGAIPMLGQFMSATRGATDAFSGVSRHVNGALTKLGAKNIEAGIGCGVGLGHGFGVGLAVNPGMVNQNQCFVILAMTKLMMKFGIAPNVPLIEGACPVSFLSGLTTTNEPSIQSPLGNMKQMLSKLPDLASQSLHGPVLKHHQIIEGLMEENQKLHQILMEDLKIPPSKLQASYSSKIKSPCSECFHCRRKQRKNR